MPKNFDSKSIENKWRKVWKEKKTYEVDVQNAKNPFYNLWMFPYPSGARMHVGHAYASTGSDVVGRFQRMHGKDVLQPMGFDAFGIHGENYAIKVGEHPWTLMEDLCNRFRDEQFEAIGNGYDWSKEVRTYWPGYYKWTQWIFVQLFKHGLAERKKANVNWCPGCKTVLADEQVIAGLCERCHSTVEQKDLEQWFFKITKFADKLLENLDHIDWSKKVIEAQRNWIGKSEGAEITFKIDGSDKEVKVFTTRPDTIFSAAFLVLAPEHPLVKELTSVENKTAVEKYVEVSKKRPAMERTSDEKDKTGVFTGSYAINPANAEKIPVWIADFVLGSYGTGAVFGDAHDERDFVFAKKYEIPLKIGIIPDTKDVSEIDLIKNQEKCFSGYGVLINSGQFDGQKSEEAKSNITKWLKDLGSADFVVKYKLRDWLISRQRYWSAPIPMIHCEKCGWLPVPEDLLPVELPYVEDWKPKGDGRGPLANISEFVNTVCPNCGGKAERETDTIDNFLDSAWYFFRYPFVNRKDVPFPGTGITGADDATPNSEAFKKWLPVNLYIGGPEHSVLHLMYTRFLTMAFKEMGFIDFDEPFVKFFAHGHITKDGKKMSKSLGNIVNPDEYIDSMGADAFRMYLMFIGPFDKGGDFSDRGTSGIERFLQRVVDFFVNAEKSQANNSSENAKKALHKTIKGVTEDLNEFKFNTSLAKMMEFINILVKQEEKLSKEDSLMFLKLVAPFGPFISEEIYQTIFLGNEKFNQSSSNVSDDFTSIHIQSWPEHDENLIKEDLIDVAVQVNGKVRGIVKEVPADIKEDEIINLAKGLVENLISGKEIKKSIYIKGRLVSIAI
ncbi:leucine--tRNA ligase [candidate division WWE3 bacterium CG_4_9_14_0_2_um_filter_35_11]|uniref:Leucine--tRNA ligase n=1 Tax=candidate division WWE3 bacterium CG_4_9_14_0_2_um_filter_35_11 TaxID=1975077 RepID=A0A2M8EMS8_UNCKA|nr:MAG: leucine--tRNA ligase [candidate division WWE3 bacterium CG10_big_fil_rev_8_21_14_0_10_35_32]PJC24039.1 MAG: leucine--tRNA ligase [candidate division WWE3 bacterium CG_4_9_14_0_2_um_filter_35_11]